MNLTYPVSRRTQTLPTAARLSFTGLFLLGLLLPGLLFSPVTASAATGGVSKGRVTGLPIPRFVSLKSKAVNLRVGPGRKYAIAWLYKKKGLPVEVIQEFDRWRRIRDSEGTTGWVLHSLLSSRRTAIVAPWEMVKREPSTESVEENVSVSLFEGKKLASQDASTVAQMQAGLLVSVEECFNGWCEVEAYSTRAWMQQDVLWGVYPGEGIDD